MDAPKRKFRVNDDVTTPLGKGVVQGYTRTYSGALVVMVRVKRPGEPTDPRCATPRAIYSSVWLFGEDELEKRHG